MPDEKISGMTAASALTGAELVELVQGGANKRTTTQDIADLGGGGSVTSVSGTTNRITSTGGATPVLDIAAAYDAAKTAEINAKVADAINNGTTTVAPSQNAVFDALALKADSLITYRTLTASHTLDATDLASINAGDNINILMNVASANDITIPPNSSQAFPVGTVISIDQIGAGETTIVAGSGVTIRTSDGLVLANQYAGAYVHKVATNEWYAKGKLKL